MSKVKWKNQIVFQLMALPSLVFLIVFSYIPMAGLVIAFQNYSLSTSYFNNPWAGLTHFKEFLADDTFWMAFRNTIQLSLLRTLFVFPAPILLALALNEVSNVKYKKIVQTCSYFPHFMAFVVVAALFQDILGTYGLVNTTLKNLGLIEKPVEFFTDPKKFKFLATFVTIWKGIGWSAIIYFAAISGVSAELYEAAQIDGAGRLMRIWHITLPSIRDTIIIMFLFSIGGLVSGNLDISMLLGNIFTKNESYIVEYYALDMGLNTMRYSFATAVGMFQSLISVILVLIANLLSRKYSEVALF